MVRHTPLVREKVGFKSQSGLQEIEMKTYKVCVCEVITYMKLVEAETEQEAINKVAHEVPGRTGEGGWEEWDRWCEPDMWVEGIAD